MLWSVLKQTFEGAPLQISGAFSLLEFSSLSSCPVRSSCLSLCGLLVPPLQPTGALGSYPRLCTDAWQFSLENQLGQSQSLSQLFLSSQGSLSSLCLDRYPEPVVFQLLSPLHFLCFLIVRTFYFLHWPLVSLNLLILSFLKILCTSVLDFGGLIWLLMKFLFLQLCV